MSFYSIAVLSFVLFFFCHMKNINQDDVDDNKVIKKRTWRGINAYIIYDGKHKCCCKIVQTHNSLRHVAWRWGQFKLAAEKVKNTEAQPSYLTIEKSLCCWLYHHKPHMILKRLTWSNSVNWSTMLSCDLI